MTDSGDYQLNGETMARKKNPHASIKHGRWLSGCQPSWQVQLAVAVLLLAGSLAIWLWVSMSDPSDDPYVDQLELEGIDLRGLNAGSGRSIGVAGLEAKASKGTWAPSPAGARTRDALG